MGILLMLFISKKVDLFCIFLYDGARNSFWLRI